MRLGVCMMNRLNSRECVVGQSRGITQEIRPRKNFRKDPRKILKYLIASRWKEEKRSKFSIPIFNSVCSRWVGSEVWTEIEMGPSGEGRCKQWEAMTRIWDMTLEFWTIKCQCQGQDCDQSWNWNQSLILEIDMDVEFAIVKQVGEIKCFNLSSVQIYLNKFCLSYCWTSVDPLSCTLCAWKFC